MKTSRRIAQLKSSSARETARLNFVFPVSRIPVFLGTFVLVLMLTFCVGCRRGKMMGGEDAYVSAPQVNLRDRLSAVYNKVGVVKNGEKVIILERNKRFARVRVRGVGEGWIEQRYLVGVEVYEGFNKLSADNKSTPVQARGVTRAQLNIHLTPERESEHLYQLSDTEKVELLKRTSTEKPQLGKTLPPRPAADSPQAKTAKGQSQEPPKLMEDWWLVRNQQGRTGWVLARMIDIDLPFEIVQYAEGQRPVACFVLNEVPDVDPETQQSKNVPQYLMLVTEPKDGMPFDYNQIRVFTWSTKRHRYETAYRERKLFGMFPVQVGRENFDKEGNLPFFIVRVQDENGNTVERKYKLNNTVVRRVVSPEEQQKLDAAKKAVRAAQPSQPKSQNAKQIPHRRRSQR